MRVNALGCRTGFVGEKRNKSYMRYDEVSIAGKNSVLRQEPPQRSWLRQMAGGGVA